MLCLITAKLFPVPETNVKGNKTNVKGNKTNLKWNKTKAKWLI